MKSHEQRLRDTEQQLEKLRVRGGGGLGRAYATVTIKAYNSAARGSFDYTCSGEGDAVVINNAIQWIRDNAYAGGRIILQDGAFILDQAIILQSQIEIIGLGPNRTSLYPGAYDAGFMIESANASFTRVADLSFSIETAQESSLGGIHYATCNRALIENVHMQGEAASLPHISIGSAVELSLHCLRLTGGKSDAIVCGPLTDSTIDDCYIDNFSAGSAIITGTPQRLVVRGNRIRTCLGGIVCNYD